MESKIQLVLKTLPIISFSIALTACSTPGSYFSTTSATTPIHTGTETYQPAIYHIDAKLYAQSIHSPDTQQQDWWYQDNYDYTVGPSDILNIIVWDHPELTTPALLSQTATNVTGLTTVGTTQATDTVSGTLINAKGNIFFPYAGNLHVAGMTVGQIRQSLTRHLSQYIKSPQVSVRVVGFRSKTVHVIGAVNNTGTVPLTDKRVGILDAIAASGGINPTTANVGQIFVVRGNQYQPIIFTLNAQKPNHLLLAEKFRLFPNDIIYVPTAHISNWNETINQLLPSISLAAYTKALTE